MKTYPPVYSKYSYGALKYCSPCGINEYSVPVNEYCKQNNISRSQVRSMLRSHELLGIKFQRKMYVVNNPNYD